MTKQQLLKNIELYKETEKSIFKLDTEFGINIWDSANPNFYNNYNLIIHNLWIEIFGESNTELLENFVFEQTDMSFDELCENLKVKDETNSK